MVVPCLMALGKGLRVVCVVQQWLFWLQKEHWQQLPKSPAESMQTRSASSACHPRVSAGLNFFMSCEEAICRFETVLVSLKRHHHVGM